MCRNIKTLYNFAPPATDDEIRASAIQFVRKLSGFTHPSKANEAAFEHAVDHVTDAARELLQSLVTNAPSRNREEEARKAKERSNIRFGSRAAQDQHERRPRRSSLVAQADDTQSNDLAERARLLGR